MITLGLKLKELRAERNWTQTELAQKSGIDRGYIGSIEVDKVKKPSADVFLKFAKAFNIRPEELYEAAGYIRDDQSTNVRKETPEEILDRLRLASPVSIPVYTDFPVHAGESTEPVEYIYRARTKAASKNIEGYVIRGNCLEPKVSNGDIIIVDREASIDHGDIVAALVNNELRIGKLKRVADELWLENNRGKFRFEECQVAAVVIEIIRRLK